MIAFLRGKIFAVGTSYLDVDVHGVGYRVSVTEQWAAQTAENDDIFVYTHHYVREDINQLLGFASADERDWFELLLSVSGIGPKGAMQMLSGATYDAFASAIVDEDIGFLGKLPGVGKKTAQRLVLELRDKVLARWSPTNPKRGKQSTMQRSRPQSLESDVLEALESLGYPERHVALQVRSAIEEYPQNTMEDILRLCLQRLAK